MLERFPAIATVVKGIVAEAKHDLAILMEIEPRRFFYCRNFLALRVIMNLRLQRMQKICKDGWISDGDGEGLIEALKQRIVQVDRFFPRFAKSIMGHHKSGTDKKEHGSRFWAWDDLPPDLFQKQREKSRPRISRKGSAHRKTDRKSTCFCCLSLSLSLIVCLCSVSVAR